MQVLVSDVPLAGPVPLHHHIPAVKVKVPPLGVGLLEALEHGALVGGLEDRKHVGPVRPAGGRYGLGGGRDAVTDGSGRASGSGGSQASQMA